MRTIEQETITPMNAEQLEALKRQEQQKYDTDGGPVDPGFGSTKSDSKRSDSAMDQYSRSDFHVRRKSK